MTITLDARQDTQPGVAVPDLDIAKAVELVYRALGRELGQPLMDADVELAGQQDLALPHGRGRRTDRRSPGRLTAWERECEGINARFNQRRLNNLTNYLNAIGRTDLLNITPAVAGETR